MSTALIKPPAKPALKMSARPLTFDGLVEQIQQTLAAGRARAEEAVDMERARTYWEAGRWIHIYELKGEDRAEYGERLIPNLAKRVGLSTGVVQDMHLFYRTSIYRAPDKLPWTHYQLLLRIKNRKQRDFLAKQAAKENWTSREMETAVREIRQKAPSLTLPLKLGGGKGGGAAAKKLIPRKGKFFTYQIVRPQNMHEGPGGQSLDLGFKIRHEMDFKGMRPKLGDIVQVVRTQKSASGDRYKIVRGGGLKRSDLYTYKAKAQIFRDADTFWVDVDLGFREWSEQKLRLRGIDALELSEAGGKKAAAYVKKVLSKVSFIVMTISGRDKFGRPLADVFYLEGTEDREKVLAEGKFLNQELLDLGLAKREL